MRSAPTSCAPLPILAPGRFYFQVHCLYQMPPLMPWASHCDPLWQAGCEIVCASCLLGSGLTSIYRASGLIYAQAQALVGALVGVLAAS